jgi:phosphopantothenoylcysteine synthetase/decarboxylase
MDGGMHAHIATQENLETLKQRGAYIIEPVERHPASGLTGKGRLPETHELIGHIRLVLVGQRLSIKGVIGEQIRGAFGRIPFSSLVRTLADNVDR